MLQLRNSEFGQPLHVVRPSPVRGQLEPQHPTTKQGWRYIQVTDTPDELKVLLPPRTAFLYGQLLKAELTALSNRHFVDWNRLVEIRHLKDRMLRKCLRLSKAWCPPRRKKDDIAFLTVPAPETFRLKELEKWMQNEESRVSKPLSKKLSIEDTRKASVCCERCSRSGCVPHRATSSRSSRRSSHSTLSSLRHVHAVQLRVAPSNSSSQSSTYNDPNSPEGADYTERSPPEHTADDIYEDVVVYHGATYPSHDDQEQHYAPYVPKPPSPDPLPHPYRHRDSLEIPRIIVTHPSGELSDIPNVNLSPTSEEPVASGRAMSSGDSRAVADTPPTIPLLRRKSSLKRPELGRVSGAISPKAVTWAMDRDLVDQISKRDVAADEAELADQEWEEIRTAYLAQMSGLRYMRQNVSQTLENLLNETGRLQREEAAMRNEEERLRATFDQLEQKQDEYRAKVRIALEESQTVVSLCTTKREAEFEAS